MQKTAKRERKPSKEPPVSNVETGKAAARGRSNARAQQSDTRGRILTCARAEFAEKGFAGARTESIVRAAGVNPNLLYHYFGSKEQLFVAVMEDVYSDVRSHHGDLELENLAPEEAIRRFTEATFDLFVASDDVIRLFSTENIHHAKHIRGSERISHLYDPLLSLLDRQLTRGREQGVFCAAVDAQELFITITSLSYFYLSNRHTLSVILRTDLNARARRERRRRHIVDVVLTYLREGDDGARRLPDR